MGTAVPSAPGDDGAAAWLVLACVVLVSLGFGLAFGWVGAQTVRGRARDTFGNAIGSLALGALGLLVFFGSASLPRSFPGPVSNAQTLPGNEYVSAALLFAGCLGLAWRRA